VGGHPAAATKRALRRYTPKDLVRVVGAIGFFGHESDQEKADPGSRRGGIGRSNFNLPRKARH